jgi:hypothetical protein
MMGRDATAQRPYLNSNIQKHSCLPHAIAFPNGESMKSDCFHISALLMTYVIQSFSGDFCSQKIYFVLLNDLCLSDSQ